MAHCVMVKGPCRGNKCDFWGRVKIRKTSVEELADGIRAIVMKYQGEDSITLETAIHEYWCVMGVRDMERLYEEDPDLCSKIKQAEDLIRKTMF